MLKRTILLILLLTLAGVAGAVKEVKTIIHTDHLGSPIMGRSMDGETLWERHYEPYGSQEQAPDDPASPGYTGHLEERDSGLVYAGARWYDPRIGRFMSPDPVGFSGSNPVSFNRYAYANNNPFSFFDPDGRESREALYRQLGMKDPSKPMADGAQSIADGASQVGHAVEPGLLDIIPAAALLKLRKVLPFLRAGKALPPPEGLAKAINPGRQGKHVVGHNNFVPGRSPLAQGVNAQELLDGVHGGTYPIVRMTPRGQPVVDFGKTIGQYQGGLLGTE